MLSINRLSIDTLWVDTKRKKGKIYSSHSNFD